MMEPVISILLLLVILVLLGGGAFFWRQFGSRSALAAEKARLEAALAEKSRRVEALEAEVARTGELVATNARLETNLENERRNAREKLALLAEAEERLKKEFQNVAQRIFDEKGKTFSERNSERLNSLLEPFRVQLEGFRKRVDEVHLHDTEQRATLLQQVKQLQEATGRVSEDANNLASAIKGDAKRQGDWGELVVERVLESSGLEAGREYDSQVAIRDVEGNFQRPDFVIYLPGDKCVIVDAKVSLKAYERFANSDEESERQAALAEHLASVRSHVAELRGKEYQHLLGNRTLDFVIMCIPVEPAYHAAMRADPNLVYDTASGNVVVTGPTTLMMTLKLIAQIWRREKENRNAEKIAARAGKLYDQVVLVYEAVAEARKRVETAGDSMELALRRIKDGRGNLVTRVDELRKLGAKVSKTMPDEVLELPEETNGEEEESDSSAGE